MTSFFVECRECGSEWVEGGGVETICPQCGEEGISESFEYSIIEADVGLVIVWKEEKW